MAASKFVDYTAPEFLANESGKTLLDKINLDWNPEDAVDDSHIEESNKPEIKSEVKTEMK